MYKTINIAYLGLVHYICTSRFLKFDELYFRPPKNLAVLKLELQISKNTAIDSVWQAIYDGAFQMLRKRRVAW